MLTNEVYAINIVYIITHRIVDKYYMAIDNDSSFMTILTEKLFANIRGSTGGNIMKMGLQTFAQEERNSVICKLQYFLFLENYNH